MNGIQRNAATRLFALIAMTDRIEEQAWNDRVIIAIGGFPCIVLPCPWERRKYVHRISKVAKRFATLFVNALS